MSPDFYKAAGSRLFATVSSLIAGIISLKLYSRHLKPEVYGMVLVALSLSIICLSWTAAFAPRSIGVCLLNRIMSKSSD